MTVRIPVLV